LAVVYGLRQFRVYLLGRHLRLRTDHAPLTWLQKTPEPIGQQGRWLDLLTEFPFDVEHRPGLKHNNADALSRIPCRQCGRTVETDSESLTTEMCRLVATDTNMAVTANEMFEPAALRRAQQADAHVRPVLAWLESDCVPPPADVLRGESRQTKAYVAQWPQLSVRDGVLLRRFVDSHSITRWNQLIPPPACRSEIIRLAHNGLTGGHLEL